MLLKRVEANLFAAMFAQAMDDVIRSRSPALLEPSSELLDGAFYAIARFPSDPFGLKKRRPVFFKTRVVHRVIEPRIVPRADGGSTCLGDESRKGRPHGSSRTELLKTNPVDFSTVTVPSSHAHRIVHRTEDCAYTNRSTLDWPRLLQALQADDFDGFGGFGQRFFASVKNRHGRVFS